jgi:hypothetical protein
MKLQELSIMSITAEERGYLRELACKQAEYAALPIMAQRTALWFAHNALHAERPLIVMEMDTFEQDMLPQPKCTSPGAVMIEKSLLRHIVNVERIRDDKVVPGYFVVPWQIHIDEFGVEIPQEHADDGRGHDIGYRWRHPIKTLKEDFHLLKPATYSVDCERTFAMRDFAGEILGDILPVKIENHSFHWHAAPSAKVVSLMGLERMMLSLVDEPEEMHALYAYLRDNILAYAKWQEREHLLTLNNGNHYAGAGSYGFSHELPSHREPVERCTEEYARTQTVTTQDLWLNLNSQETVGVSPRMYKNFIFPYYQDLAAEFGLIYYGCCEPVHEIWDCCVSKYPNLRKVSISPWCDEDMMGEALRGSQVIYSRKPSPNFIGVGRDFDAEAFSAHIRKTLQAAKGCHLEFIFRDVYTLSGGQSKPGQAVEITRRLVDELW